MDKPEQILAALKKLGPSKPRVLADHTGIDPDALKPTLKALLKAGSVKATGATVGRVYALPDQKFDASAPPQQHKPKKKKKRKGKKAKTARARTPDLERAFIPAVDTDKRLILINGDAPQIFNEEQTAAIATLLFQHYGT